MSLDAQLTFLTKRGTVIVAPDGIVIRDYEAENASCRDVAVLAIVSAIGDLQRELMRLIERPGGGNSVVD